MGRILLQKIMQGLGLVRAYSGETVTERKHYYKMNPADGKMVRKTTTYSRRKRKKRR